MSATLKDVSLRANTDKIDLAGIRGESRIQSKLGPYYLDFAEVLKLVEGGYHGARDEKGVPLNDVGAQGQFYNVITIAQYAVALHDTMLESGETPQSREKLEAQLEAIVAHIEMEGEWKGFFRANWNNQKYLELRAPWVSALAQGNGISALLRGFEWNGDPRWMTCATAMFEAMERPLNQGGVSEWDENGHFWLEEYPMNPPSHVLNGFIFALWGVLDYARATGDQRAWQWWNAGCETLRARLPDYDCGFWSVYDLSHRELATQYYQRNIHVPQLEAMHALTGDEIYQKYARRWRHFSDSAWRRGLWWIGLRVGARTRAFKAWRKNRLPANKFADPIGTTTELQGRSSNRDN